MNDDLRGRLDAVEDAVGESEGPTFGPTIVLDEDYTEDTDTSESTYIVLSSEYDPNPDPDGPDGSNG